MANREIIKISVNKQKIMGMLTDRGYSIRGLGRSKTGIGWSERTIRRGLDSGVMSLNLLHDIARHIGVDPSDLSDGKVNFMLTKEQVEWLEVMENLKKMTVRELVEDLELGGNDIDSAFSELHKCYTDDED